MAEFDEKLNSLLSDPNAMAQIMQLAQSITGGQEQQSAPPPSPPPPPQQTPPQPRPAPQPQAASPAFPTADMLSSLAGGMDHKLLMKLLPLVQELGGQDSNARTLLYALRPYLKEERQQKIERALQLARLFHVGKKFLASWEG